MKNLTRIAFLEVGNRRKTAIDYILLGKIQIRLLFIIICTTSIIGPLKAQTAENLSALKKNSKRWFPLMMPDDFDSLFLVAWRQEIGTPDPHNPLIVPAMPWDSGGIMAHGTVLHDPIDGLWKAWQVSTPPEKNLKGLEAMHEHWRRLTYLESKDGVHWYRPKLDIVKWPGYNRTNILFDLNSGGTAVYASVLVNPKNKEWPYDMFLIRTPSFGPDPIITSKVKYDPNHVGFLPAPSPDKRGLYRYKSKDGIHWKLVAGPLLHLGAGGDVAYVYKKADGSYVSYFKKYSKEPGDRIIPYDNNSQQLVRRIGRSTSPDGIHWTKPEVVFGRDWRDPGYAQYMELCPLPVKGGYIGMLTYYNSSDKTICLQMAVSRDGINWWRPTRRAALPNPPLGDYGGGMMWDMHNPIVENGNMYVYYAGAQGLHGAIIDSRPQPRIEVGNESVSGVPTPTLPFNSALCRASWDVDRLYALVPSAGAPTIGRAVTKLENSGEGQLEVDVLVKKGGWFRAELTDEYGKVLPGFSSTDCVPVTGDNRRVTIQWKGGKHAPINKVRIKFILQKAFLYGYGWEK